jgi:hypothetical protein
MKRILKNIGITLLICIGLVGFALLLNSVMNLFSLRVQLLIATTMLVGGVYVIVHSVRS